jgi:hypothetical protein
MPDMAYFFAIFFDWIASSAAEAWHRWNEYVGECRAADVALNFKIHCQGEREGTSMYIASRKEEKVMLHREKKIQYKYKEKRWEGNQKSR